MERTVTHSFYFFHSLFCFCWFHFSCLLFLLFYCFNLFLFSSICLSVCLSISLSVCQFVSYINYTNRNLIYFQLKFSLIFINFFHSLVRARTSSVQKWVCTYNEQSRRKWAGESEQYSEEHYLLKNILRESCFSCWNIIYLFITIDLFSCF